MAGTRKHVVENFVVACFGAFLSIVGDHEGESMFLCGSQRHGQACNKTKSVLLSMRGAEPPVLVKCCCPEMFVSEDCYSLL